MTEPERPRAARLEGLPQAPGESRAPLTKPVREVGDRPTPRWAGWTLIALPSLSVFGFAGQDRWPLMAALVVALGGAAAFDWWRFQDRSRTLRVAYIGLILLATGSVAALVRGLPTARSLRELGTIALATMLALALVQLYRGAETVLTLARGWLYLLGLLGAVTVWRRLGDGSLPVAGPFQAPEHLATVALTGLVLMPLGCALEHDRRLVWAYPVAAACGLEVLWWSQQAVALGVGVGVVAFWLLLGRRTRWVLAGVVVVAALVLALTRARPPLRWSDVGPSWATRQALIDQAFAQLRDTWFLGLGPGGLSLSVDGTAYPGPYSLLAEIGADFGLGAFVVTLLAGLGVLRWCLFRLLRTAREPLTQPDRAAALWCGAILVGVPFLGALQATWLDLPLFALVAGTVALLARHVEEPHGRRPAAGLAQVTRPRSPGPGAVVVAEGPDDHDDGRGGEQRAEDHVAQPPEEAARTGGGDVAEGRVEGEPEQAVARDGHEPQLEGQDAD
ncbi:MAG: hypothetical protein LBS56_05600 [Propionibacteriaceae bacterium]|jgi:hypothetical protein|nr:hypothetical protein [Propionibacteriaceae bacterium]